MINSQEIKIGTCIRLDNQIFTCIDFQHVKPGKGKHRDAHQAEERNYRTRA